MAENVTGKFDSLSQAEAAATKLRAIRAEEVEISEWNGMDGDRGDELDAYSSMRATFLPPGGNFFPVSGGLTASSINMLPYGVVGGYLNRAGSYSSSYLLNALITDHEREKAIRIIRECGGIEL